MLKSIILPTVLIVFIILFFYKTGNENVSKIESPEAQREKVIQTARNINETTIDSINENLLYLEEIELQLLEK